MQLTAEKEPEPPGAPGTSVARAPETSGLGGLYRLLRIVFSHCDAIAGAGATQS